MTESQILMRWNNIPIACINVNYKTKITRKISQNPKIRWYGYSGEEWLAAFRNKEEEEQRTYLNNIEAAMQMAQRRRRKEYENNRVVQKLLFGICRAAQI